MPCLFGAAFFSRNGNVLGTERTAEEKEEEDEDEDDDTDWFRS